jgi:hypothetical protein
MFLEVEEVEKLTDQGRKVFLLAIAVGSTV